MSVSVVLNGGILTVLMTDKNYYLSGEPVRITLAKQNISPYPITLEYPTSQRYDFTVSVFNRTVWQWSADKIFNPVIGTVTLGPGQGLSYTETWERSFPVNPGFYRVTGWNTFTGFRGYPIPSTFIYISR